MLSINLTTSITSIQGSSERNRKPKTRSVRRKSFKSGKRRKRERRKGKGRRRRA